MEKGSFHTSRLSHSDKHPASTSLTRELDERVKNIPLPSQVPPGVDFAEIPAAALKSSTLETVISQNEDLMARLSVNLRKTNELETKLNQFESENKAIKNRFETLKEQYLVLQEKDRSSTARVFQMHEESCQQKVQLQKLEKSYADLYVQAQAFQKRMSRLERYRAMVKRVSPAIQARSKVAKKLEHELVDFKATQSALHNQSLNQFESQLQTAQMMADGLKAKAQERDTLIEEKTQLENQLIYEKRQHETKLNEHVERIETLTTENANLRFEVKELLVTRESLQNEVTRFQGEIPHLQTERQRLTEQVESLQALWNHKQRELEQLTEKNRSLQKLNQQISVSLNQQRRELHALETELEQERMTSQEKVKTLLAEIQMLRIQMTDNGDTKL